LQLFLLEDSSSVPTLLLLLLTDDRSFPPIYIANSWQQCTLLLSFLADGSSVPHRCYCRQMAAEYLVTPTVLLADGRSVPCHSFCWQIAAVYLATLTAGRWELCTSPILLLVDGSSELFQSIDSSWQHCTLPLLLVAGSRSGSLSSFCWQVTMTTVNLANLNASIQQQWSFTLLNSRFHFNSVSRHSYWWQMKSTCHSYCW
jgi:hypothetical protein